MQQNHCRLTNRITAGSPTASPRVLHTIEVYSITVFKMYSVFGFDSFQPSISGILNYWGHSPPFKSLKERWFESFTCKVTTLSYTINEHFDYNPNSILINVITTWSWKNLNGCIICRLTLWCYRLKTKEQLQTTTLPEEKKAEGGSSCT